MRAADEVRTRDLHLGKVMLCLLSYNRMEPSSGADPDHAPYESAVTAVCDGIAAGQRLELRFAAPETAVLPLDDPASGAGGGHRTRKAARSELRQAPPVAVAPRMVRRQGLEPRSLG